MIEYIILENPDDRILKRASRLLTEGELVVIPSDTSWVAVCHPYSKAGVSKLYALKNEQKSKHFSLLCADISVASDIAQINDTHFRKIKKVLPGPYTFIFPAQQKIFKALKASKTDKEVGVRIPDCPLFQNFSKIHREPLLSTNITHEILGVDPSIDLYGYLIEETLGQKVSMVLDPGETFFTGASTVINFSDPAGPTVIREGAGPLFGF